MSWEQRPTVWHWDSSGAYHPHYSDPQLHSGLPLYMVSSDQEFLLVSPEMIHPASCWVEIRWIIITLWHTECGEDPMVHHWCNVLETNALLALPPCLTSISYRLWVVPYFTLLIQLPPSHLFSFFHKFVYISYPLFSLFSILLFCHKVFI